VGGVDSAWEQEKLEARKMLENAAESHTSGARFVRQPHRTQDSIATKRHHRQHAQVLRTTQSLESFLHQLLAIGRDIINTPVSGSIANSQDFDNSASSFLGTPVGDTT